MVWLEHNWKWKQAVHFVKLIIILVKCVYLNHKAKLHWSTMASVVIVLGCWHQDYTINFPADYTILHSNSMLNIPNSFLFCWWSVNELCIPFHQRVIHFVKKYIYNCLHFVDCQLELTTINTIFGDVKGNSSTSLYHSYSLLLEQNHKLCLRYALIFCRVSGYRGIETLFVKHAQSLQN